MALDNTLPMVILRFDNVRNQALWNNKDKWAQKYGYYHISFYYEDSGRKVPMVLWIKFTK